MMASGVRSRLRKASVTGLVAVSAISGLALTSANAALVHSDPLDIVMQAQINGAPHIYNVNVGGVDVFQAVVSASRTETSYSFKTYGTNFQFVMLASGSFFLASLGSVFSIDDTDIFSKNNQFGTDPRESTYGKFFNLGSTTFSQFPFGSDSYFGFEFNPTGSQWLYGYGELVISLNGRSLTLLNTTYDDSGAAISMPTVETTSVPEPSSWALLGIALTAVGCLRHASRRRSQDAPA